MAAHRGNRQAHQRAPAVSHRDAPPQQPGVPRPLSQRHVRPRARFKITSLTILFTDLRGSTALYDRIGDLAAFDLVRSHFGALLEAVAAEGGAVVKTIGDAVMATFPTPGRALRAAMRMREAMRKSTRRGAAKTWRSTSGCTRVPASRSCSTIARTISARLSTSPRASRVWRTRPRSWRPSRSSKARRSRASS